jgi:Zn-dependent peptidase ImmA (M78 family)
MTVTALQSPTVDAAISYLYKESEAEQPSVETCIVPLQRLVTACPLRCVELNNLTRRRAIEYYRTVEDTSEVFEEKDEEPLAGFLYATSRVGTIFAERTHRITRRRFTVAHELGHYLRHLRPLFEFLKGSGRETVVEISEVFTTEPSTAEEEDAVMSQLGTIEIFSEEEAERLLPTYEDMEREADEFAGELLMPAALVRELAKIHGKSLREKDLCWRLADEMLVSYGAMNKRLNELSITAT